MRALLAFTLSSANVGCLYLASNGSYIVARQCFCPTSCKKGRSRPSTENLERGTMSLLLSYLFWEGAEALCNPFLPSLSFTSLGDVFFPRYSDQDSLSYNVMGFFDSPPENTHVEKDDMEAIPTVDEIVRRQKSSRSRSSSLHRYITSSREKTFPLQQIGSKTKMDKPPEHPKLE